MRRVTRPLTLVLVEDSRKNFVDFLNTTCLTLMRVVHGVGQQFHG